MLFLRDTFTASAASPPVETVPATTNPRVERQNGHIGHLSGGKFLIVSRFYRGDGRGGVISTESVKKISCKRHHRGSRPPRILLVEGFEVGHQPLLYPPQLPVVAEVGPEIGPGVAQVVADEDITVAVNGAVGYAVGRGDVRSPAAILEVLFAEVLLESHGDDGGGRVRSIAAQPVGVHAADGRRESVGRAVEGDGGGLSVVGGDDAH